MAAYLASQQPHQPGTYLLHCVRLPDTLMAWRGFLSKIRLVRGCGGAWRRDTPYMDAWREGRPMWARYNSGGAGPCGPGPWGEGRRMWARYIGMAGHLGWVGGWGMPVSSGTACHHQRNTCMTKAMDSGP